MHLHVIPILVSGHFNLCQHEHLYSISIKVDFTVLTWCGFISGYYRFCNIIMLLLTGTRQKCHKLPCPVARSERECVCFK